jgi:hypothetical protein
VHPPAQPGGVTFGKHLSKPAHCFPVVLAGRCSSENSIAGASGGSRRQCRPAFL